MDSLSANRTAFKRPPLWFWLIPVVVMAIGLVGVVLFIINRDTPLPPSWGVAGGPRPGLLTFLGVVGQKVILPLLGCLIGVLIERKQPGNRIGRLLILAGLGSAVAELLSEWVVLGYYPVVIGLPGADFAAWVTNWIWIVLISIIFFVVALFPDGKFLSGFWQNAFILCLLMFIIPGFVAQGFETPLSSAFQVSSPYIHVRYEQAYNTLFAIALLSMVAIALVVAAQASLRFRGSSGVRREQMKWFLAGAVVFGGLIVTGLLLNLGGPNSPDLALQLFPTNLNALGGVITDLSPVALLVGIGVAMLRHQLYDIDLIIRRTTSYAIVTGALVLIYLGSVIVLQRLLSPITGNSNPAIVLSTLLIAALFLPIQRGIQRAIDRRFFRQKYDAEKVLTHFAETVRDETDLDALTAELARVIQDTMQPEFVSVWLMPSEDSGMTGVATPEPFRND